MIKNFKVNIVDWKNKFTSRSDFFYSILLSDFCKHTEKILTQNGKTVTEYYHAQ